MIEIDVIEGSPHTAENALVWAPTRTITLPGPAVTIASTPGADVVVPTIGPIRLRLVEEAGSIVVEDLQGRRPTRTLETGAVLKLGKLSLRVCVLDPREHELLTALRAAPADAMTRSVYADWLEEHGQTQRAWFLRAQLAAAEASTPTDPKFRAAANQIYALRNLVSHAWRASVGMVFVEHCPVSPNSPTFPRFTDDVQGLELLCPLKWEQLEPTDQPKVRACGVCKKEVALCESPSDAMSHAMRGSCVAMELSNASYRGSPGSSGPTYSIGSIKPRR